MNCPSDITAIPTAATATKKLPLYVMFTDLDKTVTPIDTDGIERFILLLKKIKSQGSCEVKFVPVSGRSSDYVRCFMHMLRTSFERAGLENVLDLAAGEQGATVIDCDESYWMQHLGSPDHLEIKRNVKLLLEQMPNERIRKIVADEPAKLFTCSIHIIKEAKSQMTSTESLAVFAQVKAYLLENMKEDVTMEMSHKCLEVMHASVNKAYALRHLLRHYSREFKIIAISYSGDAPNDRECIDFVSRLSLIPGITANVFLPGNADPTITSAALEAWKDKLGPCAKRRIQQAPTHRPYWNGVMDLVEAALDEGTLLGDVSSEGSNESSDDLKIALHTPEYQLQGKH